MATCSTKIKDDAYITVLKRDRLTAKRQAVNGYTAFLLLQGFAMHSAVSGDYLRRDLDMCTISVNPLTCFWFVVDDYVREATNIRVPDT